MNIELELKSIRRATKRIAEELKSRELVIKEQQTIEQSKVELVILNNKLIDEVAQLKIKLSNYGEQK